MSVELKYDKGTIFADPNVVLPFSIYDSRIQKNRALGKYYTDITDFLDKNKINYVDKVKDYGDISLCNYIVDIDFLRDYQKEAIESWIRHNKRGCIVLPTGAGKTIIALKAIIVANSSTLIIVPTINLMEQWYGAIKNILKDSTLIGMLGGGYEEIKMITITTYDSAYLKSSYLGNKFKFLIFDEVHHLAS
ncbi:MAG: DEAD/DEAH box helicase family protein, partial [Candidatus Nitrosocosmicus sp.]